VGALEARAVHVERVTGGEELGELAVVEASGLTGLEELE